MLNIHRFRQLSFILLLLAMPFCYADTTPPLTVEIARTPAQQEWGLMRRFSLPENQGTLFIYHHAHKMDFWMFNTFIDLSIAFIDQKNVVREIYTMKAYPEKMDPSRPVLKLSDIDKYAYSGPEMTFFRRHTVHSLGEYRYALEVNAGWFDRHGVTIGARMIYDSNQNQVSFTRD